MADTEMLVPLAEIAGVFVGFGALIAVRSGGVSDPQELAPMRVVVAMGMMAIVAGLAPVTLDRYDLDEHQVWASSSALVLIAWFVLGVANVRTPEYREGWRTMAEARAGGLKAAEAVEWVIYSIYMVAAFLVPVIILLGLAPEMEAALYFTVVVLILLGAAWALLGLVYAQRRPTTT